jgi:myo-inositol-1(or 4)-monophosphatase
VTSDERRRLLEVAEAAARAGGAVVADHFGRLAAGVSTKAKGDYVSEVDLESEATIRDVLDKEAPGVAFFGEEGGGERDAGGPTWVVDPLDGTANFLHGFPIVGVSVALVEAGRPVAGVVHAPLLDETYTAAAGLGAWRDGRRLAVADRGVERSIFLTGFPFKIKHRLPEYRKVFEGAFLAGEDLRRPGAASLDLAWTAAGVFDGFFELGLGPWDVAAGAVLITEAGGVVTDWTGDAEGWFGSGDVLAGPPAAHRLFLDLASGPAG